MPLTLQTPGQKSGAKPSEITKSHCLKDRQELNFIHRMAFPPLYEVNIP